MRIDEQPGLAPVLAEGRLVAGRYELRERIGRGGIADVYLAFDQELQRDVALKALLDSFATDSDYVDRFSRQAKVMASLSHPNIVSIFDIGDTPEQHFVAMEYLSAGTLSASLRRHPIREPAETARWGIEIAAALDYAHQCHLVHRDVKPGNVLLSFDQHARVSDFGIAASEDDGDPLTNAGFRLGSATYFSPEHARGASITALSDVYALGVILYEMATGRPPFVGSPISVAYKHVYEELIPPGEMNRAVPAPLAAIIGQCLAKDPARRYASAAELGADLDRFLLGEPVLSVTGSAPVRSVHGASELRKAPLARSNVPPRPGSTSSLTSAPAMIAKSRGTDSSASPQPRRRHAVLLLGALLLGGIGLYAGRSLGHSGSTSDQRVPDLAGMSASHAAAKIRFLGLRVVTRTRPAALRESGIVVAQSPAADQGVRRGATVVLVVGVPLSVKVPVLSNLQLTAAQTALLREGFRTKIAYLAPTSASQSDGLVIAQHPASGTLIGAGSTIVLDVVKVTTVGVPDVAGLTLSEAAIVLQQSGLDLAMKFVNATSSTVANGLVIGSRPKSTARVPKGAAVVLVVSTGTPTTSTTLPPLVAVPSVIGEPVQRAAQAVRSTGLRYRVLYKGTDQVALDGRVAKITPRGESDVSPGSVLIMTIWSYSSTTTTLAGDVAVPVPTVQSTATP